LEEGLNRWLIEPKPFLNNGLKRQVARSARRARLMLSYRIEIWYERWL
jgi:hypothetical protein